MVIETSGMSVSVNSGRAGKVGGRQRVRLKNEWTQLCKSCCASRSNFKFRALIDPRRTNRPTVLFTTLGFTRIFPLLLLVKPFLGGGGLGAGTLTAFHTCFSRRIWCRECWRLISVACLFKNVLLVLDPLCVCEIAFLY